MLSFLYGMEWGYVHILITIIIIVVSKIMQNFFGFIKYVYRNCIISLANRYFCYCLWWWWFALFRSFFCKKGYGDTDKIKILCSICSRLSKIKLGLSTEIFAIKSVIIPNYENILSDKLCCCSSNVSYLLRKNLHLNELSLNFSPYLYDKNSF